MMKNLLKYCSKIVPCAAGKNKKPCTGDSECAGGKTGKTGFS
jgi:hypothetical protein